MATKQTQLLARTLLTPAVGLLFVWMIVPLVLTIYFSTLHYNLLDSDIAGKWQWRQNGSGRGQISVTDDLRELLAMTPSFHLMIAHGYSDMVTPYAVTRYVLDHLPPTEGEERAQLKLYRGGHMFYIDPDSRKAFTADARTMYAPQ